MAPLQGVPFPGTCSSRGLRSATHLGGICINIGLWLGSTAKLSDLFLPLIFLHFASVLSCFLSLRISAHCTEGKVRSTCQTQLGTQTFWCSTDPKVAIRQRVQQTQRVNSVNI